MRPFWGISWELIRVVLCDSTDLASHHLRAPSWNVSIYSVHGRGDGASLHHTVTREPSLRIICWSDRFVLTVHLPAADPRRRPTANRLSDWSPPHNKANQTAAIFHQSVNCRCGWVMLFFFVKQSGRMSFTERASPTLLRGIRGSELWSLFLDLNWWFDSRLCAEGFEKPRAF